MKSGTVPIGRLLGRLARMPAAPCDRYACAHRQRCAAERLQCRAFMHYARTGSVCVPATQPKLYSLSEQEADDAPAR